MTSNPADWLIEKPSFSKISKKNFVNSQNFWNWQQNAKKWFVSFFSHFNEVSKALPPQQRHRVYFFPCRPVHCQCLVDRLARNFTYVHTEDMWHSPLANSTFHCVQSPTCHKRAATNSPSKSFVVLDYLQASTRRGTSLCKMILVFRSFFRAAPPLVNGHNNAKVTLESFQFCTYFLFLTIHKTISLSIKNKNVF